MNSQSKTAAPLLRNLKRFLLNLGTPTRGLSFAFSARLSHPSIDASILAWRTSAARAAEGRQPAEGLLLIWKLWRRTDIAVLHRHGCQMADSAADPLLLQPQTCGGGCDQRQRRSQRRKRRRRHWRSQRRRRRQRQTRRRPLRTAQLQMKKKQAAAAKAANTAHQQLSHPQRSLFRRCPPALVSCSKHPERPPLAARQLKTPHLLALLRCSTAQLQRRRRTGRH